jgi:hypothetical protein
MRLSHLTGVDPVSGLDKMPVPRDFFDDHKSYNITRLFQYLPLVRNIIRDCLKALSLTANARQSAIEDMIPKISRKK